MVTDEKLFQSPASALGTKADMIRLLKVLAEDVERWAREHPGDDVAAARSQIAVWEVLLS